MSDIPSFGDFDLDDAYCDEGEPDSEQVARKLHQIRADLAKWDHLDMPRFDDLSDDEREVAVAIAVYAVKHLDGLDTSAFGLADNIHDAVSFFSGDEMLVSLTGDEQAVARGIAAIVIEWLAREGTLQ